VIRCYLPSRSYFAHILIARSEALVSNCNSSLFRKETRIGSIIYACLSIWNACSYVVVHLKYSSFFVSSISSIATFKKFRMNCRLKFTNSINDYISLTFSSISYSLITWILLGLILTPCFPTMHLRNSSSS
jgi:hypothetical protein